MGSLGAAGLIGTDGYNQEAPSSVVRWMWPALCTATTGCCWPNTRAEHCGCSRAAADFNESRGNGTPYQVNATRLWRYAAGADWKNARGASLDLRLYGSWERYRQTFSSISNQPDFGIASCTYRCGEIPTKLSIVPTTSWARRQTGICPWARGSCWSPVLMRTMCGFGTASRPTEVPRP